MTTTTTLTDGDDPIVAVYAEDPELTAELLEFVVRWLSIAAPAAPATLASFPVPDPTAATRLHGDLTAAATQLRRLAHNGSCR